MCRGQSSRHVAKNCGLLPEVSKDTADTSQPVRDREHGCQLVPQPELEHPGKPVPPDAAKFRGHLFPAIENSLSHVPQPGHLGSGRSS